MRDIVRQVACVPTQVLSTKMGAALLGVLLVGVGLLTPTASGQQVVTGTVTDAEEGEELPGVNVVVKGGQTGTTTQPDGAYRISVSPRDTLVFSLTGYQEREVPVDNRTGVDVVLEPATTTRSTTGTIMDDLPTDNLALHLYSQAEQSGGETNSSASRQSAEEPPPPSGAESYSFGELETVAIDESLRPRLRERLQRGVSADDSLTLEFSSGTYRPDPGLGSAMSEKIPELREAGRREVYGFLLLKEYPSGSTFEQLKDRGVGVLGRHGNAFKVTIPLDAAQRVADLEFVYWLGFSRLEQKVSPYFQRLMEEADTLSSDQVPDTVPLFINVFEKHEEGAFRSRLESRGVGVGDFDPELNAFRATAPWGAMEGIVNLDFVLFVEPLLRQEPNHDESASVIGADYIRPGNTNTGYDGSSITLGIMDSGFMVGTAASTMHQDLNKNGCGANFTGVSSVFDDQDGHGTHVLGTISGTGSAESRYRGMAPNIGNSAAHRIRAAKVFCGGRCGGNAVDAIDWLGEGSKCGSPRPSVVNYSGGYYGGSPLDGTGSTSRKLDSQTWGNRQLYVVASGNDGPDAQTVDRPSAAKTALAVGNVFDYGYQRVGTINDWNTSGSSQGPTGDGRLKPNVVAPGTRVESADAGTNSGYESSFGTSMAAPHVSGLATTLMEHYLVFQWRPQLLRAYLMATSILHEDDINLEEGNGNIYGFGRVSSYLSHWSRDNPNGWRGYWWYGGIDMRHYGGRRIQIPSDTERLKVVMTWDEPPASAGAAEARIWNLGLVLDQGDDCPADRPTCGEYVQASQVDNVLYAIIEDPEPGTWGLKAVPGLAPLNIEGFPFDYALPTAISAMLVRGDTEPELDLTVTASTTTPAVDETFQIETTVESSSYVASGVHLENNVFPGFSFSRERVEVDRKDGVSYEFSSEPDLTLGNIVEGDQRSATWTFEADFEGCEDFGFRAWSENAGTETATVTICP